MLTAGALDWHREATCSRELVGKTVLIRGTDKAVRSLKEFADLSMNRDKAERYRIPAVFAVESVLVGEVIRVPLYDEIGADAPFEMECAEPKAIIREGQGFSAGAEEMLGAGWVSNATMHFDVPRIECGDGSRADLSGIDTPPTPPPEHERPRRV